MDVLYRANVTDGLFHMDWSLDDGAPSGGKVYSNELKIFQPLNFFFFSSGRFTSGPPTDSGYEYLLKQWIQSGDPKARQQCMFF